MPTGHVNSSRPSSRTVNDGYIYQSYDTYANEGQDATDLDGELLSKSHNKDNQASATRILELRGLERVLGQYSPLLWKQSNEQRIVQLLETAGQAIQILSGDADEDEESEENGKQLLSATSLSPEERKAMIQAYADERAKKFETLAAGYATLVNEIQSGLRRQFHYLTKAGITSSQVPFKNVVYGEEKELETWLNAVDVLKESADSLIEKMEQQLLPQKEPTNAASAPTSQ
ncbi:hypothetical protein BGZ51_004366 [Haplosporangium sp. Z 767]|nr:hypothetical protein BGZ51_004366 [Haplosporangium sp. Z 767]